MIIGIKSLQKGEADQKVKCEERQLCSTESRVTLVKLGKHTDFSININININISATKQNDDENWNDCTGNTTFW